MISTIFKALRKLKNILFKNAFTPIAKVFFILNNVQYGKNLHVNGLIKVLVTRRGRVEFGNNLRLNSGHNSNIIGRQQKCIFWVEGKLTIKNNVGISASAIICNDEITIGNNVTIGGNVVIYDTDFHSLDVKLRRSHEHDKANAVSSPVIIQDDAFIGAHSTILKGVNIGKNSIVGACSVVTKNIPKNEVWAGNPAKFIKNTHDYD